MTDPRLKYASGNLPRYTSYPTAPHFSESVTAETYAQWLAATPADAPVSLYLHVPFCRRMCWYCGCHTKVTLRDWPLQHYTDALLAEMDTVAEHLSRAGTGSPHPVSQIHWGGGTPTILPSDAIEHIMERVRARFDLTGITEHAIEIDPRSVTPDLISTLKSIGVTRVSFGVQDFDARVQEAINRVQPYEMVRDVVEQLRAAGITGVNFDLIYGLPHQTRESLEETVDLTTTLRPDRIALFGYAHVPWMKTHQRMIDESLLAGPAGRLEQAELASNRLAANGYDRIGLDHFALPHDDMAVAAAAGTLRRNFQGYTTDTAETLIGLGASSISALPQGYVQNHRDIPGYERTVSAGQLATTRGLGLSADDLARRRIIEDLMCTLKTDLSGQPDLAVDLAEFAPMVADGLARIDGEQVILSEEARPLLRWAAARFDRYLQTGTGRHSVAV